MNDLPKKQLLGEILVGRHLITPRQLAHALELQKTDKGYVGEILVRLGYVEDRDIVVALVVQCNLPYIAIDKYDIDPRVIQLIPAEAARKFLVIPLDRVGDVLSVVMANPLDTAIRAEIQRLTCCQTAPFIATKNEIRRALERWYPQE